MKKFEAPKIELIKFELIDVITTSGDITGGGMAGDEYETDRDYD